MTFSDSRVVEFINQNFIPSWETASAARWVQFELGEGRSVEGIATGEIALYFCDAKGHVFDILPALQSPTQTLAGMKEAVQTFQKAKGSFNNQSLKELHQARMRKIAGDHLSSNPLHATIDDLLNGNSPEVQKSKEGIKIREERINESVDAATQDLRFLAFSKSFAMLPTSSSLVVVEPGGKDYYRWEVARRFCEIGTWETEISSTLRFPPAHHKEADNTPPRLWTDDLLPKVATEEAIADWTAELFPHNPHPEIANRNPYHWMGELFPHILRQPLNRGGQHTYDSSSLEAIRVIHK